MKGFISISKDNYINIDFVDKSKSHYEPNIDKFILFDIYGNKFIIDKKLVKGKLD